MRCPARRYQRRIVAGDVVYNQCRMYVGDATPRSRKNWIAALNPAMVVAGHKSRTRPTLPRRFRTPSVTCKTSIGLQKTATSDQELFDQMTEFYSHWVANQSWLMFGFPQS